MIKSILAAGVSAAALVLCVPASAQQADSATQAAPVDPPPMTWPVMGFDPADLDPAIKPGNDFEGYVNGKWDAVNTIPPQYSSYGVVRDLRIGSERDVNEIVADMAAAHAPTGSIEQRVGDLYAAFVNTDEINARGLAAVQPYLARIYAVESEEALARLFAMPGMPDPFVADIHPDEKNPDLNILNMWIGGYALPDRDNYLVDSEKNREMQAKYKDYLAFLLGKAGYQDPKAAADAVYALEYDFAALAFDRTLSRNPELLYNVVPRGELTAMAGAFPLQTYFDELGVGSEKTLVIDEMPPSAAKIAQLDLTGDDLAKLGAGMPGLLGLVGKVPLATWKAWAVAHFMSANAANLPSDIDQRSFDFWGTYLAGAKVQRSRERRATSVVEGAMGEAVGKLYVERHFSPESKQAMIQLVANLRAAMAQRIDGLSWMSAATKAQAHAKLNAFTVKIGYPDKFETYDGLKVSPDDPVGNSISAAAWDWHDKLKDLDQPVDRTKWHMTPQTVNAYYSPTGNEIVFPAGYLQPPNFSLKADPAVNYGAIGSTIGHEISHGFDDRGSQYDGTGKLSNWWTPEDRAKFEAKTKDLVAQYNGFCPLDDGKTCINGQLTLGENLADLAGLTIAYEAYKMSLGGKQAPVIDGLTGDQRFFISYAVSNRGKWTDELTRRILQTDPHSPDKARTNVVLSNFDAWYKAFDVKPGDKLYLPPDQRVRIW